MLEKLIEQLSPLNPPASLEQIAAAESALNVTLPADYKVFMLRSNGYEGWPHPDIYASFAIIDDVAQRLYSQEEFPRLIWFGGDLGGMGYFFDYSVPAPRVLTIDFISDWDKDAFEYGRSFTQFLFRMIQGWDPLDEAVHGIEPPEDSMAI